MQPIQNGVSYKPGGSVLRYFMISRVTPVVIVLIVLCIGLSFLSKAVIASPSFTHDLPFQASNIMGTGLPVLIVIGVIAALIAAVSAWIDYASTTFMLDDSAFHIANGILSKSEIAIPYRQIQNVNHEQSFGEKTWGIAQVIVETAGTDEVHGSESDGVLPVLDADLATALQQELLKRSEGNHQVAG